MTRWLPELGIDIEELHRTKQMSKQSPSSAFEELGVSSKDEKEKLMAYLMHHEDNALSQTRLKELKSALARAIEQLSEKERFGDLVVLPRRTDHEGSRRGV